MFLVVLRYAVQMSLAQDQKVVQSEHDVSRKEPSPGGVGRSAFLFRIEFLHTATAYAILSECKRERVVQFG